MLANDLLPSVRAAAAFIGVITTGGPSSRRARPPPGNQDRTEALFPEIGARRVFRAKGVRQPRPEAPRLWRKGS